MKGLLSFGVCVWVCITIAMPFMMECFSNLSKYYISREWGVELSECGGACYW